jgi:hypothetical protein
MSVKPELAFDVCWEVYRAARERLESKECTSMLQWVPEAHPGKLREWVADFALAGQDALAGPELAARVVMFRLYHLGLAPYERAKHFLGLSERGWVNWNDEIRKRVGERLIQRGMFPPKQYFGERSTDDTEAKG